jgi:parallel beta-helix repeat protein
MKVKTYSNPEVKNNYITNCNTGIDISYYSSPDTHNNEIYECETGIFISVSSYQNIEKNIVQANYGVRSEFYYNPIEIHHNNFDCTQYVIEIIPHINWYGVDIDAKNNYFYTINDDEIQDLIYDINDVEQSMQEHMGTVIYSDFLHQEYPLAGISGD